MYSNRREKICRIWPDRASRDIQIFHLPTCIATMATKTMTEDYEATECSTGEQSSDGVPAREEQTVSM